MIKYLAYYRKFTDKLEKTKKKEETTWKSIYHERFEAEFNNGARPKGHSECIDKMKTAAFYFYYINSFASRAVSNSDITGVDPYGIAQLKKSISEYGVTWISELHKRVKDVKIFSEDFAKILNEINKPNAIYYLDPAYFLTNLMMDSLMSFTLKCSSGSVKQIANGFYPVSHARPIRSQKKIWKKGWEIKILQAKKVLR